MSKHIYINERAFFAPKVRREVKRNLGMKYPIKYEMSPEKVDVGTHWVTLKLENIGSETLKNLEINLNSLDTYCLSVFGTGKYLSDLKPKEEEVVPFQISATSTGEVYAFISGRKNGEAVYWASPDMRLAVGREAAELRTLFAMTTPYPTLGETMKIEATIAGLEKSEGLDLEFWAHTPSGRFEELAKIETKRLSPAEEATYTTEITPKEEGCYTIHGYLYDDAKRIGHEKDIVWVQK